jgi:hypothetical protein
MVVGGPAMCKIPIPAHLQHDGLTGYFLAKMDGTVSMITGLYDYEKYGKRDFTDWHAAAREYMQVIKEWIAEEGARWAASIPEITLDQQIDQYLKVAGKVNHPPYPEFIEQGISALTAWYTEHHPELM